MSNILRFCGTYKRGQYHIQEPKRGRSSKSAPITPCWTIPYGTEKGAACYAASWKHRSQVLFHAHDECGHFAVAITTKRLGEYLTKSPNPASKSPHPSPSPALSHFHDASRTFPSYSSQKTQETSQAVNSLSPTSFMTLTPRNTHQLTSYSNLILDKRIHHRVITIIHTQFVSEYDRR
ncbi:uncharacterized protein LY89DRAFT_680811 [Mollisia scopiformis]|uniref:Uncharacterized protein n=1 Tax=Mollisia scopiformis TaxID=149040 RepID=A0A194XRL6_MOLSC|nr:uncharacterized protein LY89DRAFT_680811 [Mollisia scopiformis]KUJ22694.1 hypothetical protein LY89DRAFT_680811 [Mollisia scopiformis]